MADRRRQWRILPILAISVLLLLSSSISATSSLQVSSSYDGGVEDEDTRVHIRDDKKQRQLDLTTSSSIQKCPEGYMIQIPRQRKADKGNNNQNYGEEDFFFLHQSTYAASFPGSGDKLITKHLVEALTGLRVGNAAAAASSSTTPHDNNNVDGMLTTTTTTTDEDDCCRAENGHVIAVRTSWPHTSSTGLPTWDDNITRTFVILRNPLHILPRYFNHLYEMRNHLPHGSADSAQDAVDSRITWTRWRDTQIKSQILLFRRFVSFWMERGFTTTISKDETSRVYFSYEELVDPTTGVDETKRLAKFLEAGLKSNALEWAMSSIAAAAAAAQTRPSDKEGNDVVIDRAVREATMTMVSDEDIPCVWREVVWSSIAASSSTEQVSIEEGYDMSRPYTPENLADMSQMLLELMNRWNRHQRLLSILAVYHREVNKMYLELTGKLDEVLQERDRPQVKQQLQQQQPPPLVMKKEVSLKSPLSILPNIHFIHASHPNADNNMSSVIVLNWLMGLFQPQKDIAFMQHSKNEKLTIQQSGMNVDITSNVVSTTSNVDLLTLYKVIRPSFEEVFFVISNSGSNPRTRISDDEICHYKNVLCIEDFELRYHDEDELHTMVHLLTTKFCKRFDFFFHEYSWLTDESESNAVERIEEAVLVAIAMKDDPPEKIDLKFGVRGGDGLIIENDQAPALTMPSNLRHLSMTSLDSECELTWPQPPKGPIQTSYAASYPGCGARMTWILIEALTGLYTGDDWDNNKRGHRVVTVKTHYPHDAGQLVSWDNRINRAIVIIRNPINAIPSFFNHIYEIKNNLAIHSQRAPVNDWIEWRDRLAMIQIKRFAKFVDYWMERFDKNNHDRIIISYETLTDDSDGPEEAIRIANFLSQSEGVDPIDTSKVPCIWKAVIKYKEQVKNTTEKRRRLDLHHDSQRSGPIERPYTPVLLDAMSKMLLDLIAKWGQRHERLRTVLEGYQKDVSTAYDNFIGKQPSNTGSDSSSEKTFHVYQVSLSSSGKTSGMTVLNNLLVGLLDSEAAYKSSTVVTKTHDTNLLELYKNEKSKYDEIFFVMATDPKNSMRGQFTIDNELCTYDNVMCIEPKELIYNNIYELTSVVNSFSNKLSKRFEYFFGNGFVDDKKRMEAVKRLESINNAVAALERQSVVVDSTNNNKASKVHGKSFHIFQVSKSESEDPTPANVATNWLIGLFEPEEDYSFMVFDRERTVRKHDMTVPLESTIVTKTHIFDLVMLYKQFRSQFDEIFFVVSGSSLDMESDICQFDNVLCLQNEDLLSSYPNDIEIGVRDMTDRFRTRFKGFFDSDFFSSNKVTSAVQRLKEMAEVAASLSNNSFSLTDPKYGVHGGLRVYKLKEKGRDAGVLYYCGGAQKFLKARTQFKYSTFALFHAKSLFPEFKGADTISIGNNIETSAIPLTEESLTKASENDLLIYHSHQHCNASVEAFPGYQLHFNAEYYDLHPKHSKNTGEFTLDHLPAGKNTFVLGPHQDSSHSIRVPYCSMRLWYLHMTGKSELNMILEPANKPKNSRERFMIYSQSHYVEYRERAALAFSNIAPIHTAGKCEGNIDAGPTIIADDSTPQCIPFDDKKRPASIQPIADLGMDHQLNNIELFASYRYTLVFENSDSPGYVSEKILHAFLSGTIPIYCGSRFVFDIFNPKAFIFFDLDLPHQALSLVQFLEQTPSEYDKMMNEPILAQGQSTIEKYFSWDETVGNGMLKMRIRNMMGLSSTMG